jgi:hypothetical protein
MIKSELYKIFSKKIFLILFVVLLLLNGFFIYNKQIKGNDIDFISANAKISLNNDIAKYNNNNDKIKFVHNKLKALEKDDVTHYTDDSYSERTLLDNAENQLKIVSDYKAYINQIIEKSDNITGVSIFEDSSSFSYKNAVKTAEDYKPLSNIETAYSNSEGVNMATDFMLTDLIVILLLCIVCDALIGSERNININSLQRTCRYGRNKSAISKMVVGFITTAVICLMFYGVNYIIAGYTYGFGDLFRPIQSVDSFSNCTLRINVLQYLMLHFITKVLVMYLIYTIVNVLSMVGKSKTISYIAFLCILIVSYCLNLFIGDNTSLMCFKYINLISFVDTKNVISHYRNINIFGEPINYVTCFWIVLLVLLLGLVALNILIYSRKKITAYNKSNNSFLSKLKISCGSTNVIVHELYKTFVSNKVGIIILVVLLTQLYITISSPIVLSNDEKYQKYYFSYYAGDFNSNTKSKIENQIKKYEDNKKSMDKCMSDYDNGLITKEKYEDLFSTYSTIDEDYSNFKKYVIPYYDYLINQSKADKSVSVVNYNGYCALLGLEGNLSNTYCLALYVLMVICIIPIFTVEYERKSIHLLSSTKLGFKSLVFKKIVCSCIVTALLNLLIYVPYFIRIISSYGINELGAAACSIEELSNISDGLSILNVIIITFAIRLLVSLVITVIISGISLFTKNTIISIIITTLVFVVPLLLPINDINILNSFSFYHLQNFNF